MPDPPVRRNGRPQACEPCRAAKVACDRGLPTCLRCKRRSMSLNCTYSARGAARPSQAERWAGEDVLRDSNMRNNWPLEQQMVLPNDGWMPNASPYVGIDPNLPLDPMAMSSLQADPSLGGVDLSTFPGSLDASYLMAPQNQQEELNANLWDQQARMLVNERGPQSNLTGDDPDLTAVFFNPYQNRRVPNAPNQVPVTSGPGSGPTGYVYPNNPYGGQSGPQQQSYSRRYERR